MWFWHTRADRRRDRHVDSNALHPCRRRSKTQSNAYWRRPVNVRRIACDLVSRRIEYINSFGVESRGISSRVGTLQPMMSASGVRAVVEARRNIAKMLIVVVCMFALCYLPVHLINMLRWVNRNPICHCRRCERKQRLIRPLFTDRHKENTGANRSGSFRICFYRKASLDWLVALHRGKTLVFDRRTFPVPRSTCSWRVTTYVGKSFAIGQPTIGQVSLSSFRGP